MSEPSSHIHVSGGTVGFIATTVHIENLYGTSPLAQPTRPKGPSEIPPCPYPGLAYFGPNDGARFFGRDTLIERLVTAVTKQPITAIVGPSGSGKSSLALAGVAPKLHSKGLWRFSHFRVGYEPNKDPFMAFARAVVPLLSTRSDFDQLEEVQNLAIRIKEGNITTSNILGACRSHNPGKRILIIADQFEELFTLVERGLRIQFIDTLLTGFMDISATELPNVSLLITLRADFHTIALQYPPLPNALKERVEKLGRMSRDELRDAIIQPAGAVRFEPGLVDTLLDEVQGQPAGLPLLQFALREMWSRQEDQSITRESYDSIGGIEGAIAKRAEAIFADLTNAGSDEEQVRLFRLLFTRLITFGEGVEDTRRVVDSRELGPSAWSLAQRLAGEDNRLIVTTSTADGNETAEVVHEALIRNWPTLIEWASCDRDFQSWLRLLRSRIEGWRRDPDDVLRGGSLAVAEDWLSRRRSELNEDERDYIGASLSLRDRLAQEERKAQEFKLSQAEQAARNAQAARRKIQSAFFVAIVLLVGTVAALFFAIDARNTAEKQLNLAVFTADAMNQISGSVSAKASDLAALAESAVHSSSNGEQADQSSSDEEQIETYLAFARYFERSWDIDRAYEALKSANTLISELPATTRESQRGRQLLAASHELAGDTHWAEWREKEEKAAPEFARAKDEYRATLDILTSSSGSVNSIARVRSKLALALLFTKDVEGASNELDKADKDIGTTGQIEFEQALIMHARARLFAKMGNTKSATTELSESVELLRNWLATKRYNTALEEQGNISFDAPNKTDAEIELASQLQVLGDLQRLSGDPHAFDSYVESSKLFHQAEGVDPKVFAISTGLALDDVGLRLLAKRAEADAASDQESSERAKRFNTDFSRGIGAFQFGMTIEQVHKLLNPAVSSLPATGTAWEWRTTTVPYLFRGPLGDLPDFKDFVKAEKCLANSSMAIFMFHEDKLFQIVVRFLKDPNNQCLARDNAIDDFADRYDLQVSGGRLEKRARYETSLVSLTAYETAAAVNLNFVRR